VIMPHPGSRANLRNWRALDATGRISSNLKGRVNKFGWLQATTTIVNNESRFIRYKKELCLKLDERACLLSRSATRPRSRGGHVP
jgi:hypothetical protein